ncbi:hypothetical protein PM3016_1965 [Paenibacillus mucilaginosus 3016]|uniref:Membrane protein YkvI n=2 Tax=Paenibacillus mucilaginosus TaxID=61624 RepID=H6NA23_9BACL|nr:membrane protein [Paenibacillus mucilaginosus]AFC28867.1 hypothetical protein PM3016_1965 [Paenibacillus mucilaginosus 3016]AFH61044.1 membrane protein [Paenibacillus mucilaginosus K02]WFA17624.1 hypothetical protein ERY13_10210 [Paenibacillus mucilaginosus]
MKKWTGVLQVSFTYVGTVVGAGFATGQEILQFFTRYGWMATFTIGISTFLFIWLGIKLMILANDVGAKSYEDLNKLLFGEKAGGWVSLLTLISLFGVSTVMLAGSGAVFSEQLGFPHQLGLLFTLVLAYILLVRGMDAIMAVNTVVVPLMGGFICLIVWQTIGTPGAGNWLTLESDYPAVRIWFSPLLYAAFNLTMAQAVLVPLGVRVGDRSVLRWGGIIGGIWIGVMLLAGHFALSAHMPGITQYDIPTGQLIHRVGPVLQLLFVLVIYGEIFTTLLSDVYGLVLQLEQRTRWSYQVLLPVILCLCYFVSQVGFKTLLSSLYPLFGMLSLAWLVLMILRRSPASGGA